MAVYLGNELVLANGVGGVPMSTSTPVVYNGRAYLGVSGATPPPTQRAAAMSWPRRT